MCQTASHLAQLSFTVSRPRIPFGWRYEGQNVTIWSAVCSSAPHSQDAVKAMPRLCIDEGKRPTPVRRQFSRTQAGLGNPIPGGKASTSSKMKVDEKCPLATQCSTCGPPILLHWCPVRLHLQAVPEHQAQRDVLD